MVRMTGLFRFPRYALENRPFALTEESEESDESEREIEMSLKAVCCRMTMLFGKIKGKSIFEKNRGCLTTLYHFFGEDAVFYINGSQVLPAPLDASGEAKCLAMLKSEKPSEAEKAKNTLVERNLRLVVYIAKRFENTGIGIEDLISIGTLGLIKAINTFNTEKNIKLATYASRCIENEILMYIRKTSRSKNDVSLEDPLNVDWDGNELLLSDVLGDGEDELGRRLEDEEERNMLHQAVARLNPRDRQIIELRFGLSDDPKAAQDRDEMTQKEVADLLGISQSYISRLEKRIIAGLKKDIAAFYR